MRILSLCLSPDRGGLEIYTFRTMQLLAREEMLALCVTRPDSPLSEWVSAAGWQVVTMTGGGKLPIIFARALAREIDQASIDIIHINWGRDLNLAVLAKRLSRQRPALVYTRHMRIPGSKTDPYHRWFYNSVDRVFVTTREMYEQAVTNLPIDPRRIIHNYLGVPTPTPAEPEEWADFLDSHGLSPGRFTVGLFGRLEHDKGQHILIKAVHKLVIAGYDLQAVLIGGAMNPGYLDNLESQLDALDLRGRVALGGFQPRANRFMKYCDVVVLASHCEHFGLVLVEAMLAGAPVIGTSAGGVPEIIDHGETGLMCAPGNVDELVRHLQSLYDNPALAFSLASAGQRKAHEKFAELPNFQTFVAQLQSLQGARDLNPGRS